MRPRGAAPARAAWRAAPTSSRCSLDVAPATRRAAAAAIGAAAGNGYSVSDWRSMNGGLFSALAIQQTTLFLRHRPDRRRLDVQRRGDARHDRPGEEARHRRADDARRRAAVLLAGLPLRSARCSAARVSLAGVALRRPGLLGRRRASGCCRFRRASPRSTSSRTSRFSCACGTSRRSWASRPSRSSSPPGCRRAGPRGSTSPTRCGTSDRVEDSAASKRIGLLLAALSCAATAAPRRLARPRSTSATSPAKIRVGEVAHYVKSNLDGSKPTRVSIFVVAPDRLEVAKVEQDVTDAAWVRAHFDWTLFTSDQMDAAVINLDGSVEERAVVRRRPREGGGRRDGGRPEGERRLEAASVPRLQLRLHEPELRVAPPGRPEGAVYDRHHRPDVPEGGRPDLLPRRREDRVRRRGRDVHGQEVPPLPDLGARDRRTRRASIWWDPKSGWLEKIEIPFRDNPDWNSFKLELRGHRGR